MKYYLSALYILFATISLAQTPQIARVSSDGNTTSIYTDIKKALSDAQNDDFIYIPAGIFKVDSLIIQKRINIIGTGIYPDSTKATGKTVINGTVYLKDGRDGGSIQGVELIGEKNLGYSGSIIISATGNFNISKTMFLGIYAYDNTASGTISIKECVVHGVISTQYSSNGSLIYNVSNSIINDLSYCYYGKFTNCIFFNSGSSSIGGGSIGNLGLSSYCEFRNCIFRVAVNGYNNSSTDFNNRLYNCHVENYGSSNKATFTRAAIEINTSYDGGTGGSTFVGGVCPNAFSYSFDYHIKNTSLAAGSGIDGTDKGIYGSFYPYNPNPYNPHIYFKSIAPTTNAQGQLQINVKVKAQ